MTVLSNQHNLLTSSPPVSTSSPPPPTSVPRDDFASTNNDDVEAGKIKKKRGLWSKFLIKIHLKKKHKKGGDTERIIEEDEVFTTPVAPSTDESNFKRKSWKSRSLMKSWKYNKRNLKKNENFDEMKDKTQLISKEDSHESIPQLSDEPTKSRKTSLFSSSHTPEKYSYQGKRVDLALIPDKYELLNEEDVESNDDSGIQDDFDYDYDSEDDLFNREQQGMRSKLQKGWNGERAKNARRSLRRGSSQAWRALQSNLSTQNHFPEPNSVVQRLRRTQSARRYKNSLKYAP